VILPEALDEPETRSKFVKQPVEGIPRDRQPAASCRAVVGEGRDENMAIRFHRSPDLRHVPDSIIGIGQEVEHGPVVPDIETPDWQLRG
jgi:hypothetical protein